LCVARFGNALECFAELVELDLVRVRLRCVRPRVPHQALQCDEVTTALADEAVGEAVPELVRGEVPHTRAPADTLHHPPQRLLARGRLRVPPATNALVLSSPELDLYREYVVAVLRLELFPAALELENNVRVERQPMPMATLPLDTNPPALQVDVIPGTTEHLRPSQTRSLHQQDCGELMCECRRADPPKLVETRPVDVGLPLRRTADLPRRISVNQIFRLCPGEERVQHRDDVGTRRSAEFVPSKPLSLSSPPLQEVSKVGRREVRQRGLRILSRELGEDPPIRIDGPPRCVTLEAPPVQERIDGALDPHPASLFSSTCQAGRTARRTNS
jgi:hypothetical protein